MIEARQLTVMAAGRRLLREVTLSVHPGEVMAVIGPNGAGKSTLLRALAGELSTPAGMVLFDGQPIQTLRPGDLARRRAVVSQSVDLAFAMRVFDVVMLGRLPWHGSAQAGRDTEAVVHGLQRAGVLHLREHAYATLSGGERQRVQLARALAQMNGATRPSAILLDEPTASLDVSHRVALLRLLRLLAADRIAILVILHDLNEASYVADRVAVLDQGRIACLGTPDHALAATRMGQLFGVTFREGREGGLIPDFRA